MEAAFRSRSSRLQSPKLTTSLTPNWPLVSVPVLSKTTVSRWRAFSNWILLRISRPLRADTAVIIATTSGTASPRACGQVMTITVTIRSRAKANRWPRTSQTTSVIVPTDQGDDGQRKRGLVRQALGPGLARGGLLDELDHLRQVGILARPGHLDGQRAGAVDGAADHLVVLFPGDRPGLAGDHGLVDLALAVDDPAVGGHLLAGPDQHLVARLQLIQRDVPNGAVRLDPMRLGRQQPGQILQRLRRAHHGAHLDPVAQQHDVDQRGQLPEEDLPAQAEDDQAAVHICDGDGQGDQRHHARQPVPQLIDEPFQEGPAAVEEDERGEGEQDPHGRPGRSSRKPSISWTIGERITMGTVATREIQNRLRKSSTMWA